MRDTLQNLEKMMSKTSEARFKDYSTYNVKLLQLGGVSDKIVIDNRYILKFGKSKLGVTEKDYITEFVACRLAKELGYNVQEVELAHYKGRECVAIKMFDEIPVTFSGLGGSTLGQEPILEDESNYSLDWLLGIGEKSNKLLISRKDYKQYVWSVFALDALLSNFDRHPGNWGFTQVNNKYMPSPLYDMGNSLYTKFVDEVPVMSDGDLKDLLVYRSRCAIKIDGKKKNYFEIIEESKHEECFRSSLQQLLSYDISSVVDDILQEVKDYNVSYTEYCKFVKRAVSMKVELLKRVLGGNL